MSGKNGRIRIGRYGNVGFETEIESAARHIPRDFWQRTEKRFHAVEIHKDRVTTHVLHSWRK